MARTLEKLRLPLMAALLAAVLLPSDGLEAQLALGAQVSMTDYEPEGTTWGFGGRAMLGFPLTGLYLQASSDIFRRDCESGTCYQQEMGANLLWTFPLPIIVKPYLGAGVTLDGQYGSGLSWSIDEFDLNVIGGAVIGGTGFQRFRPFVEARYTTREGQTFFSAGLLFYLF